MEELGYTGYERLRNGFDLSFGGQDKAPMFSLVVDAGCGTGKSIFSLKGSTETRYEVVLQVKDVALPDSSHFVTSNAETSFDPARASWRTVPQCESVPNRR